MKIFALLFAALAAAGCGSDEPSPPTRPAAGPLVKYERTGGYASQPVSLVVQRNGNAHVDVTTAARTAGHDFKLSRDDLATLTDALADARDVKTPQPVGGCADCYEYTVTADGVNIRLDSVSYEDDGTPAELVTAVAILEEVAAR